MNIKVSIIVAVYNAEDCLTKCLDSIISQTYKNLEIICVNDASTDSSQTIINEFVNKDGRIKCIIHKENLNAGGAMNDGIKTSTGEYVCIVDNDDWLCENAIEELVLASNNGYYDIVTCDWCKYKNEIDFENVKNLANSCDNTTNIKYSLLNGFRILGSLIRKSIFIDNSLFFPERKFYEDNALGCLLCYAKSIYPLHKVLYYYNISTASVTRSMSVQKILDRIETTDLFIENFRNRNLLTNELVKYVEYRYIYLSFATLRSLFFVGNKEAQAKIDYVINRVRNMMPNELINERCHHFAIAFKYPTLYFNYLFIKNQIINIIKGYKLFI